jgi:hypothetical protein
MFRQSGDAAAFAYAYTEHPLMAESECLGALLEALHFSPSTN